MAMRRWEPVEDGKYSAANPKDNLVVEGPWLIVHEVLVEGKSETADTIIALPDNIRLCRATEGVWVEMTPKRIKTLRYLVKLGRKLKFDHMVSVLDEMLAELEAHDDT